MWETISGLFDDVINYVPLYKDFVEIFNFFAGLLMALISVKLKKRIDIRKRKKFLSLNHKNCLVVGESSRQRWFETFEEMCLLRNLKVYNSLIQLMIKLGVNPLTNADHIPDDSEYDEILFEGPAANIKTNFYLNTYFPQLKYYVDLDEFFEPLNSKSKYNKQFKDRIKAMNCIVNTTERYAFGVGEKTLDMISGQTDFAILIKLTPEDFPALDKKRTVHILFGWSLAGSRKSIEYFLNHYKKIYKKFNRNHYFIAVKVNKFNNEFIADEDFIDLTEEAFGRGV